MPKRSMLPNEMLNLFDFAAVNPIQGPLMTQQMMLPTVMLQSIEQQEREIHRMNYLLEGESERVAQEQHEEKQSVAAEGSIETEEVSTTSFNLVYYNPETNKAEVIKEHVTANVSDYAHKQQEAPKPGEQPKVGEAGAMSKAPAYAAQTAMSLDQSVGQKSTYPLYMNVATPIAMEVVDPIRLEIALKKIEVESPKPFGGAAGMSIAPEVFDKVEHQIEAEGIQAEIVAVEVLRDVESLRAETLKQLDIQIKSFEHVIEELEVTDIPMEDLVKELPPLSKERYLVLLEKERQIAETIVVDMLIADLEFLVVVKEKLKHMGLRGLLDTLKKLGKTPKLGIIHKIGGGDDDEDKDKEEKE